MFDVVIVGSGAAGCVVAARLADSGSRSVLLLEAGPDLRADTPSEIRDGWRITRDFDWGYLAEPDPHGVVRNLWRNKLLGGTSWVTRFTPRGSPADYDEWAALGNEGWGFEDVLPYFKRLETDVDFGDERWHGDHGPMPSTRYLELEYTEIAAAALRAITAAGFPAVDDHNRPRAVGVGRMPMSTRDGVRVTTADAYLPLGGTPANLTIRADAQVADVLFDGIAATGVRLLDGTTVDAGWVVLCAGTYGSPPILMRSGIGPADHLRSVGIPVRIDLPELDAGSVRRICRAQPDGPSAARPEQHDLDLEQRHVVGRTARVGEPEHQVRRFIARAGRTVKRRDAVEDGCGPNRSAIAAVDGDRGMVGEVLANANFRDTFDVERLAEGYDRALEVACSPEIRSLCAETAGAGRTSRRGGACEGVLPTPFVGTCSMGPRPDDGAVVDGSGRVCGVERLSVVDASIMPDVPSGFTHIPTIMIAERLSDEIVSLL
jgi:choline dehydrogenase